MSFYPNNCPNLLRKYFNKKDSNVVAVTTVKNFFFAYIQFAQDTVTVPVFVCNQNTTGTGT
jgi:hypothetical protein